MTQENQKNKEGWVTVGVDWDPEGLAQVRQAVAILKASLEEFIKTAAEAEARKVIRLRGGMMDISAVAERLGAPRGHVVSMISSGQLKARKIEGEWLVEQESVDELTKSDPGDQAEQIELDLRELVRANALQGLETEGDAPSSFSLSWCYINQAGVLVCPRKAWRKVGREKVVTEAKSAVRRFLKRQES